MMRPCSVNSVEPELDYRDLLSPETRARLEALGADGLLKGDPRCGPMDQVANAHGEPA